MLEKKSIRWPGALELYERPGSPAEGGESYIGITLSDHIMLKTSHSYYWRDFGRLSS